MGTAATVGIDDNLATRQTGIAVGAADDKLARGVDVILDVALLEEGLDFGRVDALTQHAGNEYVDDVLTDARHHLRVGGLLAAGLGGGDELVVLGRYDDGVDTAGTAVVVILHRHLTLGVGTQIGHLLALAANLGQHNHQVVRQREGQGHEGVGLVVGIAEHHALVAGTLLLGIGAHHAAVDVGALLVDGGEDAAALGVKLILSLGVANAGDGAAHDGLQVGPGVGPYLAGHHHLTGGDKGFAGHLSLGILRQQRVEHSV